MLASVVESRHQIPACWPSNVRPGAEGPGYVRNWGLLIIASIFLADRYEVEVSRVVEHCEATPKASVICEAGIWRYSRQYC
jgi:hypothetical protein